MTESLTHPRKPSLRREIAAAAVLAVCAVLLEATLEHTRFAHQLSFASNRLFQEGLTSSRRPPVAVVDISDLQPEKVAGREKPVTPRRTIRNLIVAVAHHDPRAIGVDVDLNPDPGTPLSKEDRELFDDCLNISQASGIPIALGVDATVGGKPADWLGAPEYRALAAAMRIPDDTRRMPRAIGAEEAPETLPSLSAAVAASHGEGSDPERHGGFWSALRSWLVRAHIIRQFFAHQEHGLTFDEYLVDYGTLESIFTVRTIAPDVLKDRAFREPFEGRIVLLGKIAEATDRFPVPGRERQSAGVMLHASGAATLAGDPLYDVTPLGGIVLSFLLICAVLTPVLIIRAIAHRRGKTLWIAPRVQGVLVVIATVVAFVCCGYIVRATHIMWDGFFLAFFALAFHQPVEDLLHILHVMFKAAMGAEE
jgi:CHASE2 domain-containing sensor protein